MPYRSRMGHPSDSPSEKTPDTTRATAAEKRAASLRRACATWRILYEVGDFAVIARRQDRRVTLQLLGYANGWHGCLVWRMRERYAEECALIVRDLAQQLSRLTEAGWRWETSGSGFFSSIQLIHPSTGETCYRIMRPGDYFPKRKQYRGVVENLRGMGSPPSYPVADPFLERLAEATSSE